MFPEIPNTKTKYFTPKLGENKIRILQLPPLQGYKYWLKTQDKDKPVRVKTENEIPNEYKDKRSYFWVILVWNYTTQDLAIWELTQMSLMRNLSVLSKDADLGDIREYDLKIIRSGEGKDTRYSIMNLPKIELNESIKNKIKETKVNLEALFENKDPFNYVPTIDINDLPF